MTMSVDGLVSGMDTTTLITQLMQAEADPQTCSRRSCRPRRPRRRPTAPSTPRSPPSAPPPRPSTPHHLGAGARPPLRHVGDRQRRAPVPPPAQRHLHRRRTSPASSGHRQRPSGPPPTAHRRRRTAAGLAARDPQRRRHRPRHGHPRPARRWTRPSPRSTPSDARRHAPPPSRSPAAAPAGCSSTATGAAPASSCAATFSRRRRRRRLRRRRTAGRRTPSSTSARGAVATTSLDATPSPTCWPASASPSPRRPTRHRHGRPWPGPDSVAAKVQALVDAANAALHHGRRPTRTTTRAARAALKGDATSPRSRASCSQRRRRRRRRRRLAAEVGLQLDQGRQAVVFDKAKFTAALKADPALASAWSPAGSLQRRRRHRRHRRRRDRRDRHRRPAARRGQGRLRHHDRLASSPWPRARTPSPTDLKKRIDGWDLRLGQAQGDADPAVHRDGDRAGHAARTSPPGWPARSNWPAAWSCTVPPLRTPLPFPTLQETHR